MQHIYHKTMYAVFVMHVLFILTACNEKPAKKEKILSDAAGQTEQLLLVENESLAESFIFSNAHIEPSCEPMPYTAPDNLADLAEWLREAEQIKAQIFGEIHGGGLTEDFAVQLALVNNPNLLAYYENLEIGYADLLQAGLRQNPVFKSKIRYPDDATLGPEEEFELTVDFLDFFLIPFRENAALAELQVIESELGQMVLDLVKEVKINWVMAKTLTMEVDQELKRVELKKIAWDLAELQKKAGNIGNTNVRNLKIAYELAKNNLNLRRANLETAREKLNRSLGLFGPDICFFLAGEIDWRTDFVIPEIFDMEEAAIENRLDIEAIRREIRALAEKARLKDPWTYSNLVVGRSVKYNPDGSRLFGPIVQLDTPIFDSGEAARAKSFAQIEQAQKKLVAKAVEACSEVREFFKTMNIYQADLETLEKEILPTYEKQISDAIIKHNMMTFSIYEIFEFKDGEIDAIIDHIHTLRNYLIAKIELLHAMGGDFEILGGKI